MSTWNNIKAWRAAHPEKQAEYHKRWEASPKGAAYKARQRLKDHWAWARNHTPAQAGWMGPWIAPSGAIRRGKPKLLYDCHKCGRVFLYLEGDFGQRDYCSEECRQAAGRGYQRRWREENPTRYQRWAEAKGRPHEKGITRLRVLKRDDWTCHLCGEAIPKDLEWDTAEPPSLYGSIDHVIPRSLPEAGHTWDNVRAAHWLCNVKRGNQLVSN
jgi:5-methylcytosine-specific restriction endonuclease McrA